MNDKQQMKNPALAAKMYGEDLRVLCRKENRSMDDARSVATALVYEEDIARKPPSECTPAVELAKKIVRLEHEAEIPGYPETARQFYAEHDERWKRQTAKLKKKAQEKQQ
jgi:hypothetical protein